MGGNFTVFSSAVSALSANSQALSIVSNNIANVNTPGFSRQRVTLASRPPQGNVGGIKLGLGVEVGSITRIFDRFAELRLADATSQQSEFDTLATSLQSVEKAFNEVGRDGLSKAITDFFNGFHDLAADPTSVPARNNVLNKASIVSDRMTGLSREIDNARTLIDGDVEEVATKLNSLATEIVDLNLRIQQSSGDGDLVLRDQRQLKVRELAQYVDVSTVETSDDVFQVYIGNGLQLVNGASQATIGTQVNNNNDGLLDFTFAIGAGNEVVINDRIQSGSLRGLLDARDTYFTNYKDQLDELAYTLATEFNRLHTTGYDLDSNTLVEFFDESQFTMEAATGTDLLTEMHDGNGDHMRIRSGDVITIAGNIGGAFSTTYTVTANSTMADLATALQTALQANGVGTETAAVRPDGAIRVTAATTAITGLQLSITGRATFNTAFDFPDPIAIAGTGDSDTIQDAQIEDAARFFTVSSSIATAPRSIAASGTSAGIPGDNTIALALANTQTSAFTFSSGSSTFVDFYSGLLSNIGTDSQNISNRSEFASALFEQAEIVREKISGVSLEEEQLELVKYQSAFQAAARLVSIAADVLGVLSGLGE